jgi:hypothetical protein
MAPRNIPQPHATPRRRRSLCRALFASSALAIAAGIGGFAYLHRAPASAPTAASNGASPESTTALGGLFALAHVGARPAGRVPGDVTHFTLTLDSDIAIATDGKRKPIGGMRTSGTLAERTLQATADGVVSLLAVEGASVTFGNAHQSDIETALAAGIVVERNPQGTTTRVRLPNSVSSNGARVLRTIADLYQWTPPGAAPEWSASEATSLGVSSAKYTRADSDHVRKAFDVADAPGARASMRGELLATMDGPRVASLHGEETIVVRESASIATNHVSLDRTQSGSDLATAMRVSGSLEEAYGPWMALDAPLPRSTGDDDATLDGKIAGRSLEQLQEALTKGDRVAVARATDALGAYARLHPEACAGLAQQAAAGDPKDAATHARVQALVLAGNPEAQRGLFDVAKAWKDPQDSGAVIAAIGTVTSPTSETADHLRAVRLDQDVPPVAARNADVALGNVASKLRDSDPTRADAIAADIGDRLSKESDPADVVSSLVALGNSHSERAHDVAAQYLQTGDPMVRRVAVYAYGRNMDDDARARIKQIAESDPDPNVRDEAARMLGS